MCATKFREAALSNIHKKGLMQKAEKKYCKHELAMKKAKRRFKKMKDNMNMN